MTTEPTPPAPDWLDLVDGIAAARAELDLIRDEIDVWIARHGRVFLDHPIATAGWPDGSLDATGFPELHREAWSVGRALVRFVDAPEADKPALIEAAAERTA